MPKVIQLSRVHCIAIGNWLVLIPQQLIEGYNCTQSKALCIKKSYYLTELFNIVYFDQDSSAVTQEIEGTDELQIVLQPPNDGLDFDKHDALRDGEESSANFKNTRSEILLQTAEISD